MSAGGGAAPEAIDPYLIAAHGRWMENRNPFDYTYASNIADKWDDRWQQRDFDIERAIQRASDQYGEGSPFAEVLAFDPGTLLTDTQRRLDALEQAVADYDPVQVLDEAIDRAVIETDRFTISDTELAQQATDFDARQVDDYKRAATRALLPMSGGAFSVLEDFVEEGLAALTFERQYALDDFTAKLNMLAQQQRVQGVITLGPVFVEMLGQEVRLMSNAFGMTFDHAKSVAAAKQDQIGLDLTYEAEDALWDVNLFQYGANGVASMVGAAVVPRERTFGERLSQNAITSASLGVQMGTVFGSVEAGLGFGVGMLLLTTLLGA